MKKRIFPMKISCKILLLGIILLTGQNSFASGNNSGENLTTQAVTQQGKATEVQGVVSDDVGPIIGATIRVKETGIVALTDVNGKFKINVSKGETLVITYVGYQRKEVRYSGEGKLEIYMVEDMTLLDEVQVIAYGTAKKVTVTGAVSSINTNEILKAPVGNVANALSGKVTGFSSVQSSGQPGADDPKIYVRGVGSLTSKLSSPLMMVDGVERSFYRLDPNEIENITILKDASATAVFGVRGANGVILVTTKRGKEGPAKISFSTSFASQMPTSLPEIANSYEHAMASNAAQRHDGVAESGLKFSPEMIEGFRTHSNPLVYPDVDWLDMLTKKTAMQSQHNLNISGGSENVRYFASLGVFTQEGLFKSLETDYDSNYNYNRYNYRINMDIDVTKTTLMQVNLGGRLDNRKTPNYNSGTYTDLRYMFRDIYMTVPFSGAGLVDGKRVLVDGATYAKVGNVSDGLNVSYGKGYSTINENTLNFDFYMEQKLDALTKGLKVHVKGAYNSGIEMTKRREGREAIYQAILQSDGSTVLKKTSGKQNLGYAETYGRARDWYLETAFNYKRDFGLHHVSAMAMYNQSMRYYPKGSWPGIPRSYVGFVGRATYDFNTKYLLDLSVGYNGSENFAPGKRFGTFPAGSAGWILSEEKFMEFLKPTVDYLKFRASYGLVGNDIVDDDSRFLYLPDSYNIKDGNYNFGTSTTSMIVGASEAKKGNPNVTWEKASKQNYGMDLHFFGNQLKTSFDYFIEHRIDILRARSIVPGYLAVTLPTGNIGKVDNGGFEASVRWESRVKDFEYFIGVNLSYAKNEIIFMDEVKYPYEYMQATGKPVGQNFGYKYDGFFSEQDILNYPAEKGKSIPDHGTAFTPKAGDVKYKDLNDDHKIDDKDIAAIGYPVYPLLSGGINMGVSYKGFDLSMTWAGASKTSRLVTSLFREPFGATGTNSILRYMIDDAWTPEKGNSAGAPAISYTSKPNNYRDSDLWLRDASYIRLKNIELGYQFPKELLHKTPLSSFRLYVSGYNLLTFDKLNILDPEADPSSVVEYPVVRVVNFGLRAEF